MSLELSLKQHFGITHERLADITQLFSPIELQGGSYFSKPGNFCDSLSYLDSGYIRMFQYAKDRPVTQWVFSPGHFVTDIRSFIFRQRSNWYFQALEDCTLYSLDIKDYQKLNEQFPDWKAIEIKFLSECFLVMENRIFSLLSLSAEDRYLGFRDQFPDLLNNTPLQYLASLLNMTPETLSRIRKKLDT